MSRITRKELKSDKFAFEIGQTVSFFEEHQKEALRYGAIAIAAVVVIVGYVVYQRHQHVAEQEALSGAILVQEAAIATSSATGGITFPTQEAKDQAALKAFGDLRAKYSGSTEADISQYYIGAILADQGKLAEAEKSFLEVADKGDAKYSSLAKLSLAQIYFSDGRADQGEKVLRDLIAHPTIFASKNEATITLARFIMAKKPAEARKLLDPLRNQSGNAGQVAVSLYSEIPAQ